MNSDAIRQIQGKETMVTSFLTTRQLQEILQVDRTTIYRMAESGRIPGMKVGNQWRFPRTQIEAWLKTQSPAATVDVAVPAGNGKTAQGMGDLLPMECVQLIQDTFADTLGVMILITDLDGNPITEPSNPCGLFVAMEKSPNAHKRCLQLWADLARAPSLQPTFTRSHLGLMCARGLIRVGAELKGMLVVGGIAPADWPPREAELQRIAQDLDVDPDLIRREANEVFVVEPNEQKRILGTVQRIADIMAHIATERSALYARLQNVAALPQL